MKTVSSAERNKKLYKKDDEGLHRSSRRKRLKQLYQRVVYLEFDESDT